MSAEGRAGFTGRYSAGAAPEAVSAALLCPVHQLDLSRGPGHIPAQVITAQLQDTQL